QAVADGRAPARLAVGRPRERLHDPGALELAHVAPDGLRGRGHRLGELVQGCLGMARELAHDAQADGVGDRLQPGHVQAWSQAALSRATSAKSCAAKISEELYKR